MFQDAAEAFRAWREGREGAFEALYAACSPRLMGFCRLLAREEGAAVDLFQDTWKRALERSASFRFECPPEAWLSAIARNLWRMDRRSSAAGRRALEGRLREAPDGEAPDPEKAEVRELLALLDPDAFETVLLYHYEGCTLREIAALQGRSHVAVRDRLAAAHDLMREAAAGRKRGTPLTTPLPGASGGQP